MTEIIVMPEQFCAQKFLLKINYHSNEITVLFMLHEKTESFLKH